MKRGGFLAGLAAIGGAALVPTLPFPAHELAALPMQEELAGLASMLAYSAEAARELLIWQMLNLSFKVPNVACEVSQ